MPIAMVREDEKMGVFRVVTLLLRAILIPKYLKLRPRDRIEGNPFRVTSMRQGSGTAFSRLVRPAAILLRNGWSLLDPLLIGWPFSLG